MITVLSGVNQYAISVKLAHVKSDFIKENGTAGLENYNGSQLELGSMAALLGGATLFATNRLVVIKDLSLNKPVAEQLIAMLDKIPKEVHVVLVELQLDKRTVFYKTLKKQVEFLEIGELEEPALAKWVSEYVSEGSGKIDSRTVRLLIESVGVSQLRLSNELDKLLAFNPEITADTISRLIEKRPEDTVFQLLDSALSSDRNQHKQAMRILDNLESAHEDPFQVANMLIWQTHILAVVQSAGNRPDSEIAKAAKINPFVVRKTKTLVTRLSRDKINQIINAVADLDTILKSSSVSPWRVLEQTILSF